MLQYNLERPLNFAPNFTKTKEEHLKLLEQFTDIIEKSGISLSKKKAEIMKTR